MDCSQRGCALPHLSSLSFLSAASTSAMSLVRKVTFLGMLQI
jgi:hypothetical protein